MSQTVVGVSRLMLTGIDSVYYGRIYYTPAPFFDLLPDYGYKQKVSLPLTTMVDM